MTMNDQTTAPTENVWKRGLAMLLLAILFGLAQSVLMAATLVQFIWMVVMKSGNKPIADFGVGLSRWMAKTALFQTGASEDKPFPWSNWS